jgi:hypothetical protein
VTRQHITLHTAFHQSLACVVSFRQHINVSTPVLPAGHSSKAESLIACQL